MDGPLLRASSQRTPLSGRSFGPDLILGELIGRGGMSRVYHGWVRGTGADVAVKVLRDDLASRPDAVRGFVRERDLLATVASSHVVPVHDLVVVGDELGIVMDLVPGGHLRRAVGFPADAPRAAELAAQIADGLAAVHAAGVVHRDLKPENVLVDVEQDGAPLLRLTDFGISRLVDGAHLTQTSVTGTPGYLAPEVAAGGRATAAADLYALGVILYELLTGRGPFVADSPLMLVLAHTRLEAPRPEGLPDELWALLATLLAKDPTARPAADRTATRLRDLAPGLAGLGPFVAPVLSIPVAPVAPVAPTAPTAPSTGASASWLPSAASALPAGGPARTAPSIPVAPGGDGRYDAPVPWQRDRSRGGRGSRTPAVLAGIAVAMVVGLGIGAVALSRGGAHQVLTTTPTAVPGTTSAPASPERPTENQARPSPSLVVTTAPFSPMPSAPSTPAAAGTSPTPGATAGTPALARDDSSAELLSSDRHASLVVTTDGTAAVESVTVREGAAGSVAATRSSTDARRWTAVVGGLTNGTAYSFTANACTKAKSCATSAALPFTPYGAVEVPAPQLALTGGRLVATFRAVVTNGNPATLACTASAIGTPDDAGAPKDRSLSPGQGASATFSGRPGTQYVVRETCQITLVGASATVSGTSDPVNLPAATPTPTTATTTATRTAGTTTSAP